jgi:prepilin-type N-terminal cleavage/methylation domain-containing protein
MPSSYAYARQSERGFTLIEIMVALAIVGLISGAATMIVGQIFRINSESTSRITLNRQVQNAGLWLSTDIQTARSVSITPGLTGFPVVITWAEWDTPEEYQVEYYISAENVLYRHLTAIVGTTTTQDQTLPIASYLDLSGTPAHTQFQRLGVGGQASDRYSFTITAILPGYRETVKETRTYDMLPRPKG